MKELIGYLPTSYQQEMHEIVNKKLYKEYYFVMSRQMGKSMFALQQTLYFTVNFSNFHLAYITPTYKLSKKIFDEIANFLEKTKICKINRSELSINFNNNSKIKFYSAENPLAIRGTTWDCVILEEGAFFPEDIFAQVIKPTLLVKNGISICVTTPFLKNWVYKKSLTSRKKNSSIYYMKKTIWDNELITSEQIEEIIENTPKHIFEIEYMCSFDVAEKSLFDNINEHIIKNKEDITNKKLFAGIDLGRINDFSVVVIIDEDGNMIDMLRINQMSWDLIVEKINEFLKKYKISHFYIESNNIGDVIAEKILQTNNKGEIFKTTTQTKNPLIENLILAWENNEIKIIDNEDVKNEFESFAFEFSKVTRTIKYGASIGHDDIIIATALAVWSKKQNKTKGTYVF